MEDEFTKIKLDLIGTTVLPVPRVSRETIISVLRSHTDLIQAQRQDHHELVGLVTKLSKDVRDNRSSINSLEDETEKMKIDIAALYRLSDEFRTEMDELSEKVGELYALKKIMSEQQEFVEKLSSKFSTFAVEVGDFMKSTKDQVETLEGNFRETDFMVKELKDYVDHFGDNLFLSSNQITVETTTGFSDRPVTLTEVLKQCNTVFGESETKSAEHDEKLEKILADLETKAPDSVLFNVSTLEKKVATIEVHLQKEEEQGIGAIRKATEELTETVQTVTTELAEKIDRDSVGLIVHEKYEEIVRYLQDALQSSVEDENNFKQKADEIQEMIIALNNSKADRSEMTNMQELMVKSEALLKKVGAQMNVKERLKEFITKKDADMLLAHKVDRIELEMHMQGVVANSKKGRRLNASLVGGMNAPVEDAINAPSRSASRGGIMNAYPHRITGAGAGAATGGAEGGFPGGAARTGTLMMALGHRPSAYGQNPMGAYPADPGAAGHAPGGPGMVASASADFSSFVKNKKSNRAGTILPENAPPGAFRTATEGGFPGGPAPLGAPAGSSASVGGASLDGVISVNSAVPDGYGRTDYPYVPPKYQAGYPEQSAATDQFGATNGSVTGALNLRTNAYPKRLVPPSNPAAAVGHPGFSGPLGAGHGNPAGSTVDNAAVNMPDASGNDKGRDGHGLNQYSVDSSHQQGGGGPAGNHYSSDQRGGSPGGQVVDDAFAGSVSSSSYGPGRAQYPDSGYVGAEYGVGGGAGAARGLVGRPGSRGGGGGSTSRPGSRGSTPGGAIPFADDVEFDELDGAVDGVGAKVGGGGAGGPGSAGGSQVHRTGRTLEGTDIVTDGADPASRPIELLIEENPEYREIAKSGRAPFQLDDASASAGAGAGSGNRGAAGTTGVAHGGAGGIGGARGWGGGVNPSSAGAPGGLPGAAPTGLQGTAAGGMGGGLRGQGQHQGNGVGGYRGQEGGDAFDIDASGMSAPVVLNSSGKYPEIMLTAQPGAQLGPDGMPLAPPAAGAARSYAKNAQAVAAAAAAAAGQQGGGGASGRASPGSANSGRVPRERLQLEEQLKGDNLAYLSGPIVGGGFNLKNHHLLRATPSSPHKVYDTDVEGEGLMVTGGDGHLYYQDVKEAKEAKEAKKPAGKK